MAHKNPLEVHAARAAAEPAVAQRRPDLAYLAGKIGGINQLRAFAENGGNAKDLAVILLLILEDK